MRAPPESFRPTTGAPGEVLRENVDEAPVNAAKAGDEAVARRSLLLHPEVRAAVPDELVQLLEGAFIEQEVDALARSELAGLALSLAALRPAASFSFRGKATQLFEPAMVFSFGCHERAPLQTRSARGPVAGWQPGCAKDAYG